MGFARCFRENFTRINLPNGINKKGLAVIVYGGIRTGSVDITVSLLTAGPPGGCSAHCTQV